MAANARSESLKVMLVPFRQVERIESANSADFTIWIVADEQWTTDRLALVQERFSGCLILDLSQPLLHQTEILKEALARAEENWSRHQLLAEMRLQNRKISELNSNLERLVIERTSTDADSRQATKRTLDHMRDLVRFVKDLTLSVDISGILNLVRREIKTFHGTSDPILYVPQLRQLIYFRNLQVSHHSLKEVYDSGTRIRINSSEESQFLADQLGRPFAQVISFPLPVQRNEISIEQPAVLFFEHHLPKDQVEAFLTFIGERLQPVSLAVDRILLEQELRSSSRVWEQTFDGLNEPIAILDMDNQLLRANSHFHSGLIPYLNSSGGPVRIGESRYILEKYPIRLKSDSDPLSWVAYFRDETRSVKLKSQMVQVEKMSAIGHLAGHIAHELNNPLTGIRSLAQILLREGKAQSQVAKDLVEVEHAAQRCQSIINNLLEFSRGGISEKTEELNLNELVARTLPLLKSVLGRLESNVELCEQPLKVRVEPHLMQQVIFNLVNNACQAIEGKGVVEVVTSIKGQNALLEVRDTGHGIPEHLKDSIFEPFFTTKNDGDGTGLGLSLSRDFIRQFGGEIECEANQQKGTIFRVVLPLGVSL